MEIKRERIKSPFASGKFISLDNGRHQHFVRQMLLGDVRYQYTATSTHFECSASNIIRNTL
jgi:hypothetical protein